MANAVLVQALNGVVIVLLLIFTLRRLVLIVAAALPAREVAGSFTPSVVVILSARNEEANLPGLLAAFDGLDYPRDKLHFALVNDGSRDATGRILTDWTAARMNGQYIELPKCEGKAQALNYALHAAPETEGIAVYDADLRPRADSLKILASAFGDARVAAAAGYRKPANAATNPVTAYGALESFVHQLVTQAGKERLGLNPTTLGGNCLYRRSALLAAGGFPAGAFSEDVEVSLALVAAGWRTRFCRAAVAECRMVDSLGRYWNQRARWTRGIYHSAKRASRPESWLVSAGYADRIVFLLSLVLAVSGRIGFAWPGLYLLAPALAVCTALSRGAAGVRLSAYIVLWSLPMFAVDVAATLAATVNTLLSRRLEWQTGPPQA